MVAILSDPPLDGPGRPTAGAAKDALRASASAVPLIAVVIFPTAPMLVPRAGRGQLDHRPTTKVGTVASAPDTDSSPLGYTPPDRPRECCAVVVPRSRVLRRCRFRYGKTSNGATVAAWDPQRCNSRAGGCRHMTPFPGGAALYQSRAWIKGSAGVRPHAQCHGSTWPHFHPQGGPVASATTAFPEPSVPRGRGSASASSRELPHDRKCRPQSPYGCPESTRAMQRLREESAQLNDLCDDHAVVLLTVAQVNHRDPRTARGRCCGRHRTV